MAQETKDAELVAMAVLAFTHAVEVLAANGDREHRGEVMAYDVMSSPAADKLDDMLRERGLFDKEPPDAH